MQSALPAERDEISFEREVNPAMPLAWLVTELNGCVPQTDNCFKAFYDQQTVEEPILKLLWHFVYHSRSEKIKYRLRAVVRGECSSPTAGRETWSAFQQAARQEHLACGLRRKALRSFGLAGCACLLGDKFQSGETFNQGAL